MTSFLVETYSSRVETDGLAAVTDRLCHAAAVLRDLGTVVRHVGSYQVPRDEMCLHIVEASSIQDVRRLTELASLDADRISEVVT